MSIRPLALAVGLSLILAGAVAASAAAMPPICGRTGHMTIAAASNKLAVATVVTM